MGTYLAKVLPHTSQFDNGYVPCEGFATHVTSVGPAALGVCLDVGVVGTLVGEARVTRGTHQLLAWVTKYSITITIDKTNMV